jgi:hypothetical protein
MPAFWPVTTWLALLRVSVTAGVNSFPKFQGKDPVSFVISNLADNVLITADDRHTNFQGMAEMITFVLSIYRCSTRISACLGVFSKVGSIFLSEKAYNLKVSSQHVDFAYGRLRSLSEESSCRADKAFGVRYISVTKITVTTVTTVYMYM